MASTQASEVPNGFKEQLNKLLRAVLLNRPVEIFQFFAEYLEAELDRRTLYDLQLGRHTVRRAIRKDVEISKTETTAELVSTEVIKSASRRKEDSTPRATDKQRQKRPVKATQPLPSNISAEKGAKQVPVTSVPSKASGESKTPSTKRKSAEDTDRKSTKKTPKRKSTEDSKSDKDPVNFEDYFSSQKADGPIFVSESDEREGTMFGEQESGTKIGNQAEKPEVEATEPEVRPQAPGADSGQEPPMFPDRGLDEGPPSFHGFEGDQSTSAGAALEEGLPVFQGFEGQAPVTDSGKEPPMFPDRGLDEGPPSFHGFEGEQSTSAGAALEGFPVFQGFEGQASGTDSGQEPPMFQDRGLDEGPPSFHGFEGGQSTSAGAALEEDIPVFQGFERPVLGTDSGQEPPLFPDFDHEQFAGPNTGLDEKQGIEQERGAEEFQTDQGFEQVQGGTEESSHPVEGDGDSAMAGDTTTSPGKETTAPGKEITAPGEETVVPGEEITGPAEVVMAPGEARSGPSEITETVKAPDVLSELENMDPDQLKDLGLLIGEPSLVKSSHGQAVVDEFDRENSPALSIGVEEVVHPAAAVAAAIAAAEELQEEEEEELEELEEKKMKSKDVITHETTGQAPPDVKVTEPQTDKDVITKEEKMKSKDVITHETTGQAPPEVKVTEPQTDKDAITHETTGQAPPDVKVTEPQTDKDVITKEKKMKSKDAITHETTGQAPPEVKVTEPQTDKDVITHEATGQAPPDVKVTESQTDEKEGGDDEEEESELKIDEEEEEEEEKEGEGETSEKTDPSKHKEGLLSPRSADKKRGAKGKTIDVSSEQSFVRILPSVDDMTNSLMQPVSSIFTSEQSFPFIHKDPQPVTISITSPPSPPPPPPPTQPLQPVHPPPPQPSSKPSKQQKSSGDSKAPPTISNTTEPGRLITVDGLLEQVMVLENTTEGPRPPGPGHLKKSSI